MTPAVPAPLTVYPNSELVAQKMIATWIAGFTAGEITGELPDPADWATVGHWTTVVALPTAAANVDLPVFDPILEVHFWGRRKNTDKPKWGEAWKLAALLAHGLEADSFRSHYGQELAIGGDYKKARILSAYIFTEPTRVRGDASGFAHISLDLGMHWTFVE